VHFPLPVTSVDQSSRDHRSSLVHTLISRRSSAISAESKRSKRKPKDKEQLLSGWKSSSTHGTTRNQPSAVFQLSSGTPFKKKKLSSAIGAQCRQDEAARLAAYTEPIFFL
jgi:hypothetical protein